MEDDYATFYIKTSCEHCGNEIIIKAITKKETPVISAQREEGTQA